MGEETKPKSAGSTTRWAFIAFLSMVVVTYGYYFAGVDAKSPLNYISYLPFVICLALAIKTHRDDDLGGYISFGKAFNTGFKYSSILSMLMGLFMAVYLRWLNYDVFSEGLIQAQKQMVEQGRTEAEVSQAMEVSKNWGPYIAGLFTAIMYTISGSVVSLIFAALLKKEEPFNYHRPEEE